MDRNNSVFNYEIYKFLDGRDMMLLSDVIDLLEKINTVNMEDDEVAIDTRLLADHFRDRMSEEMLEDTEELL